MLKKIPKIFLVLLLFFSSPVISNQEDDKYFFEIYPSIDPNAPHYLYAQTNDKLLTINATEGENCKIINENPNEYTHSNISSVIIINNTYLVKTCFMKNKLVEIQHKENTFLFAKSLTNVKYCYSSQILNPNTNSIDQEKYVIMTYFAELQSGKINHKVIIFYPSKNYFSEEIALIPDSSLIINEFYPENCITLRDKDIYCSIHFTGHSIINFNIIGNNYIIETNKIFSQEANIFVILSNSITSTENYYKKLIPLNREESTYILTKLKYGMKDIYLTECHNQKDSIKTMLRFSYYIQETHVSYIRADNDYGLKLSDKSINPNLLNYIAPNPDEMLIIYLNKDTTKTNLLISRINTKEITYNYKGYTFNNYYRTDICSNPVYMRSTYIKSFIDYEEKDKIYMKNNPSNAYYKSEKDIAIVISCKDANEKHQTIKVESPQCLDKLDELNGMDLHNLKFTVDKTEIIFDIYNDPNMFSLRNASIYFNSSQAFTLLISIKIKEMGNSDYSPLFFNKQYDNITHIKFVKNKGLYAKYPIKLPYIIQNRGKNKKNIVNAMISENCYLQFDTSNNSATNEDEDIPKCTIDYCSLCETQYICSVCESEIDGIILNTDNISETYGKCVCDESKGFQISPELYQMCICKEDYSFYNGKDLCKKTEELENGPYYIDDIEKKSNISIYKDCPNGCKSCTKGEKDELICSECFDDFILMGTECDNNIKWKTDIWFKLGNNIFKSLQIENCIFIFYQTELFLISDKEECSPFMVETNYEYIKTLLKDDINITQFTDIENVNVYNSSSEDIIAEKYSEDKTIHFYLIKFNSPLNNNTNKNISSMKLSDENNKLNLEDNIIIFKADIKRNDTISTQVEYQLYNSTPNSINERITFKGQEFPLQLYLPVEWEPDQLEKIHELSEKDINIFDSTSPFYLDVCFKFTTSKNSDMFLEDRKKEYYIKEGLCENDCKLVDIDKDSDKIICNCKLKNTTDNYENVTFTPNEPDKIFNKKIIGPNFVAMKCTKVVIKSLKDNAGFYTTLILLFLVVGFFVYRIINWEKIKKKNVKDLSYILKVEGNPGKANENQIGGSSVGSKENSSSQNPENNPKDINVYKPGGKRNIINISKTEKNNGMIITESQNGSTDKNNGEKSEGDNNTNEMISNTNNNDINSQNNQSGMNPPINEISNINNSINTNPNDNGENKGNGENINNGSVQENKVDPQMINVNPKPPNNVELINSSTSNNNTENIINTYNSIQKERESIDNNNFNFPDGTFPDISQMGGKININYNKDNKEKSVLFTSTIPNEKNVKGNINEEKDLDLGEIKIDEGENEEEDDKKTNTIFNENVINDIESPFKEKDVKVGSMLTKGDKKKHSHKANPPSIHEIDIQRSERPFKESQDTNNKESITRDNFSDEYSDFKIMQDKKEKIFLKYYISIIKENSTLYLVIFDKKEDMFIKASLIILFISLHLFFNTCLLYEMPMVKLYLGSCNFGNLILNLFLTTFVISIIIIIIKKYMTYNKFFTKLSLQNERQNIKESSDSDQSHNNIIEIMRNEKMMLIRIIIYGGVSIIFLVFNCFFVTSFCGVYSNSEGGLFLNTFMGIFISILIRAFFFLIGTIIKYFSLKKNLECMYEISKFFDPLHLTLTKIKEMKLYKALKKAKCCRKKENNNMGNLKDMAPEYNNN